MNFKKTIIFVICWLIIVLLLTVFIEIFPKQKKFVFIPHGLNATQIAELLEKEKIIFSKNIFLLFSYITSSDEKLKPGKYLLSFSFTGVPVVYKLRKGGFVKVVIPEGFRTEQIADRLVSLGIISDPIEFLTYVNRNNLNGFLFPDTYFFSYNEQLETICSVMYKNFLNKYTEEFRNRANEIKFSTKQVIILASIIEKEAKSLEEKKKVSGVFHNRLKKGWNLESCATVRYGLKKFKGKLTYKDIQIDTPFNTYKYKGLPPQPICNPGLDAIKAALWPEQTDAMFFFTKDNETHSFSKYYKDHLKKQNKKISKVL